MLSTNWDPNDVVKVQRKNDGKIIDVDCPKVIQMYNQHMGGVDRGNQYRQYYELRTKSRKVYKYIIILVHDSGLHVECFYPNKFVPSTSWPLHHYKDVRVELAKWLIGDYCERKKRGRPNWLRERPDTWPDLRDLTCGRYMPPHWKNQTWNISGKRSSLEDAHNYCSTLGKRKGSTWYCEGCQLRLCHTGVPECVQVWCLCHSCTYTKKI